LSSGLSYLKGGSNPPPKSGSSMMGFGSEDLQKNNGYYNPPGGYTPSDQIIKSNDSKWGNSYGGGSSYSGGSSSYGGASTAATKTWGPTK
jgi:hypothetical protein